MDYQPVVTKEKNIPPLKVYHFPYAIVLTKRNVADLSVEGEITAPINPNSWKYRFSRNLIQCGVCRMAAECSKVAGSNGFRWATCYTPLPSFTLTMKNTKLFIVTVKKSCLKGKPRRGPAGRGSSCGRLGTKTLTVILTESFFSGILLTNRASNGLWWTLFAALVVASVATRCYDLHLPAHVW